MNVKQNIFVKCFCAVMTLLLAVVIVPGKAAAEDDPANSYGIPAYLERNMYETETMTVHGITLEDETGETDASGEPVSALVKKPIKFLVYNSVTQEIEQTITSKDGILPDFELIKGHNYILFSQDTEYKLTTNAYIWAKDKPLDIKSYERNDHVYEEIKSLHLKKRETPVKEEDLEEERRVMANLDVYYGTGNMYGVTVKFVSDVETVTANSTDGRGKVRALLLEDVDYMVIVEHDQYTADPFPIAVKDKSEYVHENSGKIGGKYTYDHSSCAAVDAIVLKNKSEAHKTDTTITSKSGNTSVTGMNFKDLIVMDRELDKSMVSGLSGDDYDVVDIKIVNTHRWETAKLAAGEFTVTEKIAENKQVAGVYYLDKENKLQKVDFQQDGGKVKFQMDTLSLYPVVIEYKAGSVQEPEPVRVKVQKVVVNGTYKNVAAGKKIQLTAKVTPAKAANKAVRWTVSNSKYASVSTSGKVTLKKAGAGKTVTVTATAKDGSKKSGRYTIKIMKHAVKKITLTAKKTVKTGKKVTVKAVVKTTGKSANKKLTWTVSNKKYASVSSKGVVTAKKAGKGKTITITAKATDGSNIKKTIKIKIK